MDERPRSADARSPQRARRTSRALALTVVAILVGIGLLGFLSDGAGGPPLSCSGSARADDAAVDETTVDLEIDAAAPESDRTADAARRSLGGAGHDEVAAEPAASKPAEPTFVLEGLAVDAEGSPLARTELSGSLAFVVRAADGSERVGGSGGDLAIATDEHGRFTIETRRRRTDPRGFHVLTLATGATRGERRIECLELPRCDVGVVTLVGPHVLVAGIVVDAEGRPVADAFLSMVDRAQPMGSDVGRTGALPSARTGADGRFEMRGHSRATAVTLWASSSRHAAQVFENLPVPDEDLRIVLADTTMPFVRARLALDALDCTEGLIVWLHHPAMQKDRFWMIAAEPGVFELRQLLPGTCDIEVTACGVSLAKLAGVDVPPTGPSLDPRLDGVDLRGRLECVRVSLVDDQGEPIPRGRLSVGGWTHEADARGDLALVRAVGSKVVVTDCRGVEVELVDGAKICPTR